ncbi:MAG: UTP--glucose-1-phosphate uridylyltransferase [Actinobacteria bacterium HGW-Actinobacteria-4]|nr:MAG: UTP--glucose-1-phosphate uridylyltransferase [Actinobacteria bacterium HGW-Actinobacteria-4]
MTPPLRKAVIPAAGLGTRFLPASKAIPKEMIPVVDKPAIQYVVEEAVAAGLSEVCLVTAHGKEAMEEHFSRSPQLEAALEKKGDRARLAAVQHASGLASMSYVFQDEPQGLGHAVGCAEKWVAGEPFAVLLGDDFLDERDYVLDAMCTLQQRTGGSVVLLLEVPARLIRMYGSVDPTPVSVDDLPGEGEIREGLEVYSLARLNEKPEPGEEYSNLAVIGRYVFNPALFEVLRNTPPGRGGEIQLTDAINTLAQMPPQQGGGVYGIVFRGRRYDTGDKLEYLKAVVQIGADREDLGQEFSLWLREFVDSRSGS